MKKLGTILEEAGVIDEIQLVRALSHQRKWRCRLGHSLVELGFVTEETIAKTISQQLNIPYREFDPRQTPAELLEMIPHNVAEERRLFPVGYSVTPAGKSILIAMAEPADKVALISLERSTGVRIEPVVSKDSAIEDAIRGWERFKSGNKRSDPNALITSSQQAVKPAAPHSEGEKFFEGANIEEDWDDEASAAAIAPDAQSRMEAGFKSAPAKKSPAPDVFLKGFAPSGAPSAGAREEELLSVSGLPPIDEEEEELFGGLETPRADTLTISISDASQEAVPEPPPENGEVSGLTHSDTWEHIMPGVDAGKMEGVAQEPDDMGLAMDDSGLQEIESEGPPEVDHAQPWESVMPGVDAAAEPVEDLRRPIVPIGDESDETAPADEKKPEFSRAEPWEHIMPGVDAAQRSEHGGIEEPPMQDIDILEGADIEEPEGWAQPAEPEAKPVEPSAPPPLEKHKEHFGHPDLSPPHIISSPPPGAPQLHEIFAEDEHSDNLLDSLKEFSPESQHIQAPPITATPSVPPISPVSFVPPVPPAHPVPSNVESRPAEKPKEELASKGMSAQPTLDEISGEILDLRSQVDALREEMGSLKDALAKQKGEKR